MNSLQGYYLISKERLNKFKENEKKVNLANKYFVMRLSGKSFINDKKDNTLSNELDAKRIMKIN